MIRRKFIKQLSNLLTMTTLAPAANSAELFHSHEGQNYPIIDTHQHLWDMERFKLGWPVPPINSQNFLIPDYNESVKGLNFVKSIYMEVDVPPSLRRDEVIFALDICRDPNNKTVKAVICANPSEAIFKDFLVEFMGNEYIMGVRCRFSSAKEMLSSESIANLQWLGGKGLSFDLGIPPEWLSAAEHLVKTCPETIFILNHCGNADPIAFFGDDIKRPRPPKCNASEWKRNITKLGSYPNVYCKISGIVSHVRDFTLSAALLQVPINHCLDSFATNKVIFASDWPVCRYNMDLKKWVSILKEIVKSRPIEEQKKLFYDNAASLYKV